MKNSVYISIRLKKNTGDVGVVVSDDSNEDNIEISAIEFAYMKNDDVAFLRYLIENRSKTKDILDLALKQKSLVCAKYNGKQFDFDANDIAKALGKKKTASFDVPTWAGKAAASLTIGSNDKGKSFFVEASHPEIKGRQKASSTRFMISNSDRELMTFDPREFLRRIMIVNPKARNILVDYMDYNSRIVLRDSVSGKRSFIDRSILAELHRKAISQATIFVSPSFRSGMSSIGVSVFGYSETIENIPSDRLKDIENDPSALLEEIAKSPRSMIALAVESKKGNPVVVRKNDGFYEIDKEVLLRFLPENRKPSIVFGYSPNRF